MRTLLHVFTFMRLGFIVRLWPTPVKRQGRRSTCPRPHHFKGPAPFMEFYNMWACYNKFTNNNVVLMLWWLNIIFIGREKRCLLKLCKIEKYIMLLYYYYMIAGASEKHFFGFTKKKCRASWEMYTGPCKTSGQ